MKNRYRKMMMALLFSVLFLCACGNSERKDASGEKGGSDKIVSSVSMDKPGVKTTHDSNANSGTKAYSEPKARKVIVLPYYVQEVKEVDKDKRWEHYHYKALINGINDRLGGVDPVARINMLKKNDQLNLRPEDCSPLKNKSLCVRYLVNAVILIQFEFQKSLDDDYCDAVGVAQVHGLDSRDNALDLESLTGKHLEYRKSAGNRDCDAAIRKVIDAATSEIGETLDKWAEKNNLDEKTYMTVRLDGVMNENTADIFGKMINSVGENAELVVSHPDSEMEQCSYYIWKVTPGNLEPDRFTSKFRDLKTKLQNNQDNVNQVIEEMLGKEKNSTPPNRYLPGDVEQLKGVVVGTVDPMEIRFVFDRSRKLESGITGN